MSRSRSEQPAYMYHVSGQARVQLGHQVFYLGKHGTPKSYARYYSLLAEYNANGKEPLSRDSGPESKDVQLTDNVILVRHITPDFRVRVLPSHWGSIQFDGTI